MRISRSAVFVVLAGCADLLGMGESRVQPDSGRPPADATQSAATDSVSSDAAASSFDASSTAGDVLEPSDRAALEDLVGRPETGTSDDTGGEVNNTVATDGTASATDGSRVADGATTSADSEGDGSGPQPPGCSPDEKPSELAVFVSKKSVTAGSAIGTSTDPTTSIAAAIKRATDTKVQKIYVDVDVYEESISIPSDLVILGGWRFSGGAWRRDCTNPHAMLRAPGNVGVRISAGEVTLRHLTISTANGTTLGTGEGQSTYGVWASGASTHLQLIDTDITAGKGGNGATAAVTNPGEPNVCQGAIVCETGDRGVEGGTGKSAEPMGFSAEGYVIAPATPGTAGGRGKNGSSPPPVPFGSDCMTCWTVDEDGCICLFKKTTNASGAGTCGCGGSGGAGGGAGHSGGASVGLLLTTGARLSIDAATIRSSNGGDGTAGMPGIGGVDGTSGSEGTPTTCARSCTVGGQNTPGCGLFRCEHAQVETIPAGGAGGTGGAGGRGGNGGSGRGGPSYGIVALQNTVIVGLDRGTFTAGSGGPGGAPGLEGDARARWIQ